MSDSNKLAEDRTDLENALSFAGGMRTGMVAVAVADRLQAVAREPDPTWLAKAVASIFLRIACLFA